MTAITFRTNNPAAWGTGAGANLTPTQVDTNFWNLKQAVEALEANPPEAVSVDEIIQTGNSITFHLTNGTTQGPFTLPAAQISWRGDWTASTAYAVGDIIASGSALYIVLTAHTSAGSFDPGATNGSGQDYYDQMLGQSLPGGGTEGQRLTKASGADYDFEWTTEPVPAGGTTGQLLTKVSGTDYDLEWADAPTSLPPGGAADQVLTKVSEADGDVTWADPAGALPGGATSNQILYNGMFGLQWIDLPDVGIKSYAFVSLTNDATLTLSSGSASISWTAENADASGLHATNSAYINKPAGASLVRMGCTVSIKSGTEGDLIRVSFSGYSVALPTVYLPSGQTYVGADGKATVTLVSGPVPVLDGDQFLVQVYSNTASSTLTVDKTNSNFWLEMVD